MCRFEDEKYMRFALDQARLAFDKGEIPVGAVAVHQGKVIGRGHNCKETCRDPTAHAEIIALQEAARTRGGWRLFDVTLYCTMEPCPMCAGAMVQARLSRLVYSVPDPKAGAAGSVLNLLAHPGLNHHVSVTCDILTSDTEALLADFFSRLRQGEIPRFSESWRHRKLAENTNSV
jgi:tRNA(adenine34) deaminase